MMLHLVRHGQTQANRAGLLQGHVDFDLTELGVIQAHTAAQRLIDSGAHRIVSSPLLRCRSTAAVIADALGIAVEVDDRLVELDYGAWDQRPLQEVTAQEWAQWRADPHFAPPRGESLRSVTNRVVACASELLRDPEPVVVVSHVSPIKAAIAWAIGTDESVTWRMHLDVASESRIGRRGDQPYLAAFNVVA